MASPTRYTGALKGKTALITGGACGIGRATAHLFAREGAAVVIVDRNEPSGSAVAGEITAFGGRAIFASANVTNAADCQRVVERAIQEFGAIHVLFNNAGIIRRASIVELSEQDWDRVMTVNVKSVFLMSRQVIPLMAQAGGGSIINMASGWGLTGGPKAAVYCASKGAVVLLTKCMAIDHGQENIRVNAICPSFVETDLTAAVISKAPDPAAVRQERTAVHPIGRLGQPEDMAGLAVYLASDESSWVTGAAFPVDGGYLAL